MYEKAYKLLGGNSKKMASFNETIEVLRSDIAIQQFDQAVEILGVSRKDFALMIGLNIRSLQRKKPSDHLTPQQSERILAIIQVLTDGIEYFGDENTTLKWFHTPNLRLGESKPFALMDTIVGMKIVKDTINRLKYGMTA